MNAARDVRPEYIIVGGLAGLALIGYLLFRSRFQNDPTYGQAGILGQLGFAANSASGGLLEKFGGFLGRTAYDAFHPNDVGESLYYNVQFPDGSRHAIPSTSVDSNGVFTYQGKRYFVGVRSDGSKHAVAL